MKKTALGDLTRAIVQVQLELDKLLEEVGNVLRELETNKQRIIANIINIFSPDADFEQKEILERTIEDNINGALQEIVQARSWIGRLDNVARNGVDIAKKVEMSWYQALKEYVQESRWYREHFPLEHEKRQREKEYERYRLRPETFYGKPSSDELVRMREYLKTNPEEFRSPRESKSSLLVKAQVKELESLTKNVEQITKRMLDLMTTYFSADSPLLIASNKIIEKVKSQRARQINPTLIEALGDKVQALEALFGFGEHPGRFITSGSRAFLAPAMAALQMATQILNDPVKGISGTTNTQQELQKMVEEKEKRRQEERKKFFKTKRHAVLLERLNISANRKRRCKIIQRIASSREKEDFSNG